MFWLKGCPRCSGDLYRDRDQYGHFVTCAQCGFSKDVPQDTTRLMKITAEPVCAPSVPQIETGKRRRLSHGGRHFTRTLTASAWPLANSEA